MRSWFALHALALVLAGMCLTGCGTDYRWRSSVPKDVRTVSVPTFRNESDVMELGVIASRQILREFQREGTFRICATGDAVLEVQGVVKSASSVVDAYDRRGGRYGAYVAKADVDVSVIDKRTGEVLVDNRRFSASTSYTSGSDSTTSQRDASGRLAEDLARQVVDCVLGIKWEGL